MIDSTKINFVPKRASSPNTVLFVALFLMFGVLAALFIFLLFDENLLKSIPYLYLYPWILATAVTISAPLVYWYYKGKFDLFQPIVFAAWSFWIPAFVFGGVVLATGIVQPPHLVYIQNPEEDLPWTFAYIILGFSGLTIGYLLPWGNRIGKRLSRVLPDWNWQPGQLMVPASALLGVGLFFYISAFISGIVGYSVTNLQDAFSGVNYVLSLLSLEAGVLAGIYIFRTKTLTAEHFWAVGIIMILTFTRVGLGGNRSSLILVVMLLALAFVYSGIKLKRKHAVIFSFVAVGALVFGMIYGTAFRNLKGGEEQVSLDKQIAIVEQTLENVFTQDTGKVLGEGLSHLSERIEVTSSLAVVVSNYEKLATYEEQYGLENNIWTYTWAAFIPRFIWTDKPLLSDARSYSDLYFNFGDNSFAITPMGDLLRNFGPVGVPLGMLFIGFLARIMYSILIEDQQVTAGRAAAYYLFITNISYEGFYGTIIPSLWRILVVVAISFFVIDFFIIGKKRT